ncbi:6-phosphogluconolactonase [Sulfuricella sp.]|uniref:6-phosphogluconolactonase n=1 Tax=Sulfuricella sp. TaxID=2099377 RepID=UPI002C1A5FBB|nr:6-phosphogluconolactonase [Sulfuricella sp.]HUX63350.1 6-phosphogluconolactonase [Sulfuricella sp.]
MTPPQLCRWYLFSSVQSLQTEAVSMIARAAEQAITDSGAFRLVLAGGNTPRALYERLRALKTNWAAWHIYFGDERCLPAADPERNSAMARDAWLDHVPVPQKQVYVIPAEMGAKAAAAVYSATLQPVGEFDLVLLGLGEDGHTASLFPGNDWGQGVDSPVALPVFDAPKAPAERVSLSAWRLSQAKQVLFLVTGESKHEVVMNWRAGANIPARAITPLHGVDVLAESVLLKE